VENFETLNAELENAPPQDILRWGYETYGASMAVVTSFQITGIVTLHMLQEIAPDVPVLTLDTGLLFPETYQLIEEVEARFGIQIQRITPEYDLDEQTQLYGGNLWERQPDMCCHIRKVLPLRKALGGYKAWVTGLRRDQSETRTSTSIITWDAKYLQTKIAPFATWTEEMLWMYIQAYDLPYNTLHDNGYPSIGCFPCTKAVAAGEDPRAGRWAGRAKTECGIHLPDAVLPPSGV